MLNRSVRRDQTAGLESTFALHLRESSSLDGFPSEKIKIEDTTLHEEFNIGDRSFLGSQPW